MDLLWRGSLLSALGPLEKICAEMMKNNKLDALLHVPQLVQCFLNIRQNHAQVLGETLSYDRCEKTMRGITRLGRNVPGWMMDLSGEYVLTSFSKSFGDGNYALPFSKNSMGPNLNKPSKLCLSSMTSARIQITNKKQTDETCKILGNKPQLGK